MKQTTEPKSPAPHSTRAETARINGAQSHGPVTPEGLARSSRNSLRHGLTAQAVVLETESQEEFAALLDSFLDRFHPAGAVEQELVESMAAARWRLRRLYTIESTILDNELMRRMDSIESEFIEVDDNDRLAHAFQCLADNGHSLALLVRYEAGLNRAFDRAFKQLILLQSAARPTSASAGSISNVGSFRNTHAQPAPVPASVADAPVIWDTQPPEMHRRNAIADRRPAP
jgi:hypothetical protein